MASSQWSTIGWFTGWRPVRGVLLPSALARSAAARIRSTAVTSVLCSSTAVIAALCSSRRRSSRNPRDLQPSRRNHLAHHLVDPTAEGDDQIPLRLGVKPFQQFGRWRTRPDFRRYRPPPRPVGQPAGMRSVPNTLVAAASATSMISAPAATCQLRSSLIRQTALISPRRQTHVVAVDGRHAVTTGLRGPGVHVIVDGGDLARRTEHDAFVVQLRGDQPPPGVLPRPPVMSTGTRTSLK